MIKNIRGVSMFLGAATFVIGTLSTAEQATADGALPGDRGRMFDGMLPAAPPPRPLAARDAAVPRAPKINLAVQAVQAIAEGCKQYKIGIAVVNAAGEPILVYLPDGSGPSHGYTAVRKAYSAIKFKGPTTPMIAKAREDAAFAAEIKKDPNLMAFKGGLPLRVGDEIIGAIGVSGAEPGGHDDECGQIGVNKIEGQLR